MKTFSSFTFLSYIIQHSDKKITPSWFPRISTIDLLFFKIDFFEEFSTFFGAEISFGRTINKSKSSSLEPVPIQRVRAWSMCRSSRSTCESERDLLRSQFLLQVDKTPNRVWRIVRIGKRWICSEGKSFRFLNLLSWKS